MRCLREVQTISQSPHILPMPSLTRLTTGGVLNPTKNTTNTSHNELLHQEPLQPPLEPRDSTNTRREAIRYEAVAALASRAPRTPASYPHHRSKAPTRAGIAKGPTSLRRWDPQCRWISSESDLRQTQRVIHLMILVTRPEPTVRPPSRIAKPRPGSMAMGWISSTEISVVSPGMTMSVPSGRVMTPVTSVVRK